MLRLAYHGANFFGWQRQPEERTVQGELESHFATWLRSDVAVVGAGRTDAGVHASNYIAHLDTELELDPDELVFRMNRFLPDDLVLLEAAPAFGDMHARFSAQGRGYRYQIQRRKSVFGRDTSWCLTRDLNLDLLHQMAASIQGEFHFGAFERSGSAATNGMCSLTHVRWVEEGDLLIFEVAGSRFLRNMVRALVGTMVAQAIADQGMDPWYRIVASQKRTSSGTSAPAHGLTFAGASYAVPLFDGRELPEFLQKP